MPTVLIVDDDREMRESLKKLIGEEGWQVREAEDGSQAVSSVEESIPSVVLLDLRMPGKGGQDALEEIRFLAPELPVVILTGYGDIEQAVQAMKAGARDFLTKPPDPDHLLLVLDRAIRERSLEREIASRRKQDTDRFTMVGGDAPAMTEFLAMLERVAATNSTVLLIGESGTGKELVARSLWQSGLRQDGPFVVVNCAALSEHLLESDLFGHAKGAFTGAVSAKSGRLEEATGGTLFLDEVAELPAAIQAKLLRVVEYGTFERIGETATREADLRLIAASNRDLGQMVGDGSFREDLFHRLSVVTLRLPPLRERLQDLDRVVPHLLSRLAAELGRRPPEVRAEVMERIRSYDWPGNIRELRNVLERALVMSPDGSIRPGDIPTGGPARSDGSAPLPVETTLEDALIHYKRQHVARVLAAVDGNQTRAAEILDMHRSSLNRLMKELDLR